MNLKKINHRSHIPNKGIPKFLQKINYTDFVDYQLKKWLIKYNKRK